MTFYCTITVDTKALHFKLEAASAHEAVRILGAFTRGLTYRDPVLHTEISSVSKTRTRGVEYEVFS